MRAVIFDLDGTLADTLREIAVAMNQALTALALPPHPIDAYRGFVGDGVGVLAARALGAEHAARAPELVAAYIDAYDRILLDSAPYPGVPELLDALTIPFAVVSNKPDEPTQRIVAHTFGRWHFGAILGARPDLPKKPDPAMALEAARRLGVAPAECSFVGDTRVDVHTARAAGMRAVGASWGFRGRGDLLEADLIIDHPSELLA
jgi:phosphoglycolate phosphatase